MSGPAVVQTTLNTAGAASIVGTLLGWLPPLAAALGAIWFAIQIYESDTGKILLRCVAKPFRFLYKKIRKGD